MVSSTSGCEQSEDGISSEYIDQRASYITGVVTCSNLIPLNNVIPQSVADFISTRILSCLLHSALVLGK